MITLAKVIIVQNSRLKIPQRISRREIHEHILERLENYNGGVEVYERGDPVRFCKTRQGIYQEQPPYIAVLNTSDVKSEYILKFMERQLASALKLQTEEYKVYNPQIVIYKGVADLDEYKELLDNMQTNFTEFLRADIMQFGTNPQKLLRRLIFELSQLNISFKPSDR